MQELLQAGEAISKGEGEEDGKELSTDGMLELLPGDYLWTRNEFGSRKPKDDVPVAWVVGPEKRSERTKAALDKARDKFMGPEDEITEKSVQFERLKPTPKPVKKGTRCWTLGSSLEPNTNIEAPCANGKWKGQTTELHRTTQEVVTVSTRMAMEDMAHAPDEVQEVLKGDFERHGMGPLGCKENYAYHTVQCNLAYVGKSMEGQMGIRYAGPHRDQNDCPGHYSTMITRSRLPPNYCPPRLVLPGLGAYSKLIDFLGLTFQAMYDHLGMPAYPSPGTPSSSKAYRFALIHYTPQRMGAAETRQRIGALPNIHAFLTPEMRSSKAEKDIVKGLQADSFANYLRDGPWIMEDEGYSDYVGRVCYQVNRYLLMQTPGRLKFELDPVLLAQAITYTASDGGRSAVKPWAMAPSVQEETDNERDQKREECEKRSKEHMVKHGCMIPFYFTKKPWIREEAAKRYGGSAISTASGGTATDLDPDLDESADAGKTSTNAGHKSTQTFDMDVDDGMDGTRYNLRKRKRVDSVGSDSDGEEAEEGQSGPGARPRSAMKKTRQPFNHIDAGSDDEDDQGDDVVENIHPPLNGRTVVKPKPKGRKAPTPKPEDAFKLTRLLTVDALEEEVLELRQELQAMEEVDGDDEEPYEDIKAILDDANEAIGMGGVGRRALDGISIIVKDAHRLSRHIGREENRLRMTRTTLIRSQTAMRMWIESSVAEEATSVAQQTRPKGGRRSWLSNLTNQVVDMLVHREGRKVFKGSDYGVFWDCNEVAVDNPYKGRRFLRGEEETVKAARTITMEVVEKWVDADEHCDKKQAWFASIVEEVMGEEALTMNLVWRLYNNLKASHVILGDKGYRNPTKDNMAPFRLALENHSVLEVDHREGQLFELYKQLLNGEVSPSDVIKHLPSVSPRWDALKQMIQIAMLYDNDEQPRNPPAYLKKLQSDPTTYHPLRECSPGRVRCRRDLFDNNDPVSKSTIFSLLVWRVFPQVFSWHPDDSMRFETPDDFLKAYRRIKKEHPSKDIVSDIQSYWDTLDERRWPKFAETFPTFEECYQHFKPNGTLEYRLFRRLSRTNAFDVACDLAYAGFCRPPSIAEVAKYIVHLNQGAMSGLKALGLVDAKKKDIDAKRTQVAQALMDLGNLLQETPEFMDEYAREAGGTYSPYPESEVDPMRVEHLLRTFSHALRYLG
ncbi:hypothetical protein EST38_g9008 [Candolleomyces aberdarensis]|uniref:Uncharacterized protein n=1 Tax=Candolleomyces aberdarensis TaxID=2316362 RepID=A0A4Q2DBU8_9AGAR|nr:hypothetical protein EST38_g9008 [Candolleomyces aberdarensis]